MPSKFHEQRFQRQYAEHEGCRTQNRYCDAQTALENEPSNIAPVERLLPPGPDKYRSDERQNQSRSCPEARLNLEPRNLRFVLRQSCPALIVPTAPSQRATEYADANIKAPEMRNHANRLLSERML